MVYIYKGICYMYGRTNKNSIKRESNAVKILLKNFLRKKKIKITVNNIGYWQQYANGGRKETSQKYC